MSKLMMPENLTEAEEAQWWFDNQDQMIEEFLASPQAQNPERSTAARRFGLPFSVELRDEDSKLAREQPLRRGMHFENYTAQVLHEALLERELKEAS